jgi:hypothetical protein
MAEPVAIETPTTTPGRGPGRPFEKGNKLGKLSHKGGAPKGLARRIRDAVESVGGDQNMLVTIMVQHATGYRQLLHPTDKIVWCDFATRETVSQPVEEWEKVSVSEQQAAIRWLADRGYGKALEFVPVESDDPLELGGNLAAVAAGVRQRVDELAAKRREREASAAAEAQ